jgi:hypothetical protein
MKMNSHFALSDYTVLPQLVGWAGFICPRGIASAWAQMRAHPTALTLQSPVWESVRKPAPWAKASAPGIELGA